MCEIYFRPCNFLSWSRRSFAKGEIQIYPAAAKLLESRGFGLKHAAASIPAHANDVMPVNALLNKYENGVLTASRLSSKQK